MQSKVPNKNKYAVIMAGGVGSRFWPVSTRAFPKQFHDMLGTGESLLQRTFSRLEKIIPTQNIWILTNESYVDLTLKQLPRVTQQQLVLEPDMRNTAPCILMAAMKMQKENPEALMLVAPSDHWIEDEEAFAKDVTMCFERCADDNKLMTLGITPTFPNTGYGYIESDPNSSDTIKKVVQFREKPDYATAKQFLEAANFMWNAGIFIWKAKDIGAAFEQYLPVMYALFSEGKPVYNTDAEAKFVAENYSLAENISIDYGILEHAQNVYVKEATFDWNDLGTWGALYDKLDTDASQNAVVHAKTLVNGAKNNMIFTEGDKLVVVDGLSDYIIVEKEKVLLIFPKEKEQEIKSLLTAVEQQYGKSYL